MIAAMDLLPAAAGFEGGGERARDARILGAAASRAPIGGGG
jgi:hypothetical protein